MTKEPFAVLVVEDDDDVRDVLLLMLEEEGFVVAGARNGREALDLLRGNPRPDLIVLDLAMPVMGGRAFRAEQMRDGELAAIPVVVLSADDEGPSEAAAMRAAGYFLKSRPFDGLFDVLRSHASRRARACRAVPSP